MGMWIAGCCLVKSTKNLFVIAFIASRLPQSLVVCTEDAKFLHDEILKSATQIGNTDHSKCRA